MVARPGGQVFARSHSVASRITTAGTPAPGKARRKSGGSAIVEFSERDVIECVGCPNDDLAESVERVFLATVHKPAVQGVKRRTDRDCLPALRYGLRGEINGNHTVLTGDHLSQSGIVEAV